MYESTISNCMYVSSYADFPSRRRLATDPGVVGLPAVRRRRLAEPLPRGDVARPPPGPLAAALRCQSSAADAGAGDAAQKWRGGGDGVGDLDLLIVFYGFWLDVYMEFRFLEYSFFGST